MTGVNIRGVVSDVNEDFFKVYVGALGVIGAESTVAPSPRRRLSDQVEQTDARRSKSHKRLKAVSYTHLTLPTRRTV